MLISRSWSTFGMAGWSFCQRRIGRDCVQPFSMFSLPVSRCFCVVGKQLSNSLESNCFLVMGWIDILLFSFCGGAVYFPLCPFLTKHRELSQERTVCEAIPVVWINTIHGSATTNFSEAARIDAEPPIQSEAGWFLHGWGLSWVCLTITPQCVWDALKRKEHILQNWQDLFFWLSQLFVLQKKIYIQWQFL